MAKVLFLTADLGGNMPPTRAAAEELARRDDGGWDFHFQQWSPGQEVERRGIVTLHALRTLRAHGRI